MPTAKDKKPGIRLVRLSDVKPLSFITTGVPEIDEVTGGFPRGRMTEIYGMQGVGKTELMLHCLSKMSEVGKVLYIDAENALNPERLTMKGAVSSNVSVVSESVLEDVADLTIASVNKFDVIVVDSVATLVAKAENEGNTGDQFVGLKPRLMGQWLRKLTPVLGKSDCAFVFINQLRESMSMYGDPMFTPGGKALPFHASLRIKLSTTKADRIKGSDGLFVGHKVNVDIIKSKVSAPHKTTAFKLKY